MHKELTLGEILAAKIHRRVGKWVAVALSSVWLGCSPGMFWSDGRDPGIENSPNYRKFNADCSGLSLSSSTLDAQTTRALVGCLNTYGAIDPVAKLFKKMDNAELGSLLDVGNKFALNDPKTLFALESTYKSLSSAKILDETLHQLGRVLANGELVAASMALLQEVHYPNKNQRVDPKVLKAIEILSEKLAPETIQEAIDYGLSFAGSKSFTELQARFSWHAPPECFPDASGKVDPRQCPLRAYTDAMLAYVKEGPEGHQVQLGREMIDRMLDGTLFTAIEEVVGNSPENIRNKVGGVASIMDVTLAVRPDTYDPQISRPAQIMDDMTSLFHFMNRPLYCMKGAKSVPNGVAWVIQELTDTPLPESATFLKKTIRLMLQSMNSICDYPPQLQYFYPGMMRLADHMALHPSVELMRAFRRAEAKMPDGTKVFPLRTFLPRMLSDTGVGNKTGIKHLIPMMSALNERGPWRELLLVASLLRPEDQEKLKGLLRFLVEARPTLGGQSLFDVLSDSMTRVDPDNFYKLVFSMRRFVDPDPNEPLSKEPILLPALTALRAGFYINDVSPLLDTIRRAMAEASQYEAAFNTLFRIAKLPEFVQVIEMVADMSRRNDGRLKDLLNTVVIMFNSFASQGKHPIHPRPSVPFVSFARHSWGVADLVPFADVAPPSQAPEACSGLDATVPMGDPTHPRFDEQMKRFLECINYQGQSQDVVNSVEFLRRETLSDGTQAFDKLIYLIKGLPLGKEQLGFLADKWISTVDDGRFLQLMQSSVYMFGRVAGIDGPVFRPFFDVLRAVVNQSWDAVRRLEVYLAGLMVREETRAAVQYALDLYDVAVPDNGENSCKTTSSAPKESPYEPTPTVPAVAIDRGYLARYVDSKECQSRPTYVPVSYARQQARVDEMIDDYHNAVNNWEVVGGRARHSYSLDEMKKELDPVLKKMGDPAQSVPDRTVTDALLNLMKYFTLEPGQKPTRTAHFQRDYLLKWLHERSNDAKVMMYFYPGETRPRARLVNSLDRLDLVLTESARTPIPILNQNLGFKFLMLMGEAWGDEDCSTWPIEIWKKYSCAKGSRYYPKTLRQAATEMMQSLSFFETVMGFPERPMCVRAPDVPEDYRIPGVTGDGGLASWLMPDSLSMKSSLHNMRQTMSVVIENLPDSGTPMAGGAKVLRNLFFEMYYSTPIAQRCKEDGVGDEPVKCFTVANLEKNNLWVVLRLVHAGITRNIGRMLQGTNINEPALKDFFDTLIDGAGSPYMNKIVNRLVDQRSNERALFWKVMDELFQTIDHAKGLDIPRMKQMVYYLLAAPNEIARNLPDDGRTLRAKAADLTEKFLRVIYEVLDRHGDYLTKNGDQVGKLLRSRETSLLTRGIYEDVNPVGKRSFAIFFDDLIQDPTRALDAMSILRTVDGDAVAKQSWDLFTNRMDLLKVHPGYCALRLDELTKDMVNFVIGKDTTPLGRETAAQLRGYFADKMQSGDFDTLIKLAAAKPDQMFSVFETMARYSDQQGDLWKFTRLARRALAEVY